MTPHVAPRRVAEIVLDEQEWNALWTLASLGMATAQNNGNVVAALYTTACQRVEALGPDRWRALNHRAIRIGAATWPELYHDVLRIFPQGHGG